MILDSHQQESSLLKVKQILRLLCTLYHGSTQTVRLLLYASRAGAEEKIREYLVENNFIDAVIQMPDNLFFGASIATCILVMKKNKSDNKILFMDASDECVKSINNNRLSNENISRIVEAFIKRENIKDFCRLVDCEEVKREGFNLSVSTYVMPRDQREKIDISQLNQEINNIVEHVNTLRQEINKLIQEISQDE